MSLSRIGSRDVVALEADAPVLEAVQAMGRHRVGSVIAVEDGRAVGILTDRDIVLRVLGEGRDAAATSVRAVMSRELVTVGDACPPDDAAFRMREHRVRRLPVVDEAGRVLAIVTLDDLLGKVAGVRPDVAEILSAYHAPYQFV